MASLFAEIPLLTAFRNAFKSCFSTFNLEQGKLIISVIAKDPLILRKHQPADLYTKSIRLLKITCLLINHHPKNNYLKHIHYLLYKYQ